MLFRIIQSPKEGEKVQFLGVHAVRWKAVVAGKMEFPDIPPPPVAFVEATDEEIRKEYERIFGHPH